MVSARLTAPFATSMAVPPLLLFLMALGQIPSVLGEELEAVKPSDPTTTATSDPAAPGAKSPLPPLHWSDFKLELLLVAALVTYVANYFYGSSKNAEEARLWEIPINNKLKENFQRIGPPSSGGQQQVLEYDGPADRLFWATGRRYCKVIQGHLQLLPRQDLFGLVFNLVGSDSGPRMLVDIQLQQSAMAHGFVFAITTRKRARAVRHERFDVGKLTHQESNSSSSTSSTPSSSAISPKLVVHSEHSEITSLLLKSGIHHIAGGRKPLLEELYISDQPEEEPEERSENPSGMSLRAMLRLPSPDPKGLEQVEDALEVLLHLVDYLCESVKLPPTVVKKLERSRNEAYKELDRKAEAERQDQLAKIKADRRKQRLEQISKLPLAERRKAEEKERKRELKKSQMKRTRVVK